MKEVIDIGEFYESHIDKIFNFCLYKTGSRFVAEDLASSVFMKFIAVVKKRSPDNPLAYLYQIARNVVIDHYRGNKGEVSLESLMENGRDFGVEFEPEKRLLINQILTQVNSLPEDQKEVILLQYVQDLDNRTIAEIMGKTEGAVKSLSHRALETLRMRLNTQPSFWGSTKC